MKKIILKIAKDLCLKVNVEVDHREFDIYDYTISCNGVEDTFTYYTGRTRSGVKYPFDINEFLRRISSFLKQTDNGQEGGQS